VGHAIHGSRHPRASLLRVARCLEVEVASQGENVEEALANLKEALELYFEDMPLPEGVEPPVIATVELSA